MKINNALEMHSKNHLLRPELDEAIIYKLRSKAPGEGEENTASWQYCVRSKWINGFFWSPSAVIAKFTF